MMAISVVNPSCRDFRMTFRYQSLLIHLDCAWFGMNGWTGCAARNSEISEKLFSGGDWRVLLDSTSTSLSEGYPPPPPSLFSSSRAFTLILYSAPLEIRHSASLSASRISSAVISASDLPHQAGRSLLLDVTSIPHYLQPIAAGASVNFAQ